MSSVQTPAQPGAQWFALHTLSGQEPKVKTYIEKFKAAEELDEFIVEVLLPTETVSEVKGGKKSSKVRKLYPGYVFIELTLDKNGMIPEKVWFLIKETDGVGDFIGSNGKPTAMAPKDQAKMLEEAERPEEEVSLKTEYKKGDKIKVTNGAFINFEGNVEEIMPDKGMVRIVTTIFGRPTPLELEYWQIEKV